MAKSKAARAKKVAKRREPSPVPAIRVVDQPSAKRREFTPLQMLVIQAMAKGFLMPDIARKYQHQLVPHEPNRDKRLKKARTRLRRWMGTQKFRDALWEASVQDLDLQSPHILSGVARKAASGRVDAARLALEVTGRHAPHTEVQPAQINIQFGDIPRPDRAVPNPDKGAVLDADDEIEDAEWEEA